MQPLAFEIDYSQVECYLRHLLTKKQRNNGVLSYALRATRDTGSWEYPIRVGFTQQIKIVRKGQKCSVIIDRFAYDESIKKRLRFARKESTIRTIHTQNKRSTKKSIQGSAVVDGKVLVADNDHKTMHFPRHDLCWTDAVTLIALASRRKRESISRRFYESIDHTGKAILTLGLDFQCEIIRNNPRDKWRNATTVKIWTTKNNNSQIYQRLRKRMRAHFNLKRKEDRRRQKGFVQTKKQFPASIPLNAWLAA